MIHWLPVIGSTRIVAHAYDPATETIYVRFPNGIEWLYSTCPPHFWEQFTAPGQSRGRFIHAILNRKPNRRYIG
jgi:hypothetical protein